LATPTLRTGFGRNVGGGGGGIEHAGGKGGSMSLMLSWPKGAGAWGNGEDRLFLFSSSGRGRLDFPHQKYSLGKGNEGQGERMMKTGLNSSGSESAAVPGLRLGEITGRRKGRWGGNNLRNRGVSQRTSAESLWERRAQRKGGKDEYRGAREGMGCCRPVEVSLQKS